MSAAKSTANPTDGTCLGRPQSAALDQILGQRFDVLDDGFVRVVDYMGCDSSIVQAARVSYGAGTKTVSQDRGLIRYLLRHRHTTPLEMCEIKLHVRVPMDCWRQWIRHRTANINEYSTRYSVAIDAAQTTKVDQWRSQAANNKQGSDGQLSAESGEALTESERVLHELARQTYDQRLELGVAREQARKDLPLSTYTEAYWKIDLHNLFHFLSLRMDMHAQEEIRRYADVIGREIVARWVPLSWEAFEDYRLGGRFLSRLDSEIITSIGRGDTADAIVKAESFGWLSYGENGLKPHRERAEFEAKLMDLGMAVPWQAESKGNG